MSTEITITSTTIDINVTEYPITIEAPSGAYPLPTSVYSVFGRTGNVVATEGDYTLTQLAGVTITSPVSGQALVYNGTSWVNNTETYVGTVTNVSALTIGTTGTDLTSTVANSTTTPVITLNVPTASATKRGALSSTDWSIFNAKQAALNGTGFVKISGTTISYDNSTYYLASNPSFYIPLTALSSTATGLTYTNTTGVFSTTAGYGIPTTASQTTWDAAYNDKINSAAVTGTTTKTLTLNQQDGGTVTASWTDINTDAVSSVFGRTGAVVAQSGDYTTTQVTEGTNLYFTDVRARNAVSFTAGSGAYNSTTGVFTIPTNTNQLTNGASFITLTSLSASSPLSYSNTTGAFSISQANTSTNGYLSSFDWNTFNSKQTALTLGNLTSSDITVTGGTGAVVGSGATMTLATVNTNVGAYGDSTHVPTITVNAKGLVTAASQTAIPTATNSVTGLLTYADWSTFNGKQNQLNGTGFVKASGTTITYDNSTYLTTIEGITAGGELSGTYASPSLVNSAVTGKVLTGVNITGGTIVSTDSILTAFGKVQNQINGLIGGSLYKGTWNANTNNPALASGVGTSGWYYIVSVAGTTNLDGITDWQVGDWAIFQGSVWQKVDNTDAVVSVNGFTGAVSLTTSNITEGTNLYYTDARARLSNSAGTGISYNSTTGVITNSAPDQTVSLTGAGTTSISGTYPSFTITSNDTYNGTVTSIGITESVAALSITGSPVTTSGNINIGFAGTSSQYVGGDGSLITFPSIISQASNLVTEVYNETGATLTKGTIVYINGGHGNLPTVAKALATADSTSAQTYGFINADLTNNNNGFVTVIGSLENMDTQAYANGTQLYLSGTTAGTYTSTKPQAPIHLVYVAVVVRSHPTQGVLEVRIQNGYELDELHDVQITSVANNNILQYNAATSLWKNVAGTTTNIAEGTNLYYTDTRARASLSFVAGSGAYNSTTGVITIPTNNTQITNGSNYITLASLSATSPLSYNNTTGAFTIAQATTSTSGYLSSTDWNTFNSKGTGTVTSVAALTLGTTGTDVSSSVATSTTTPVITLNIPTASATNRGALSSTDWTTFNNKQAALTNPVTLSGSITTNYHTKWTGTNTIGNSLIWDNGTNVGIGNTNTSYTLDVSGTGRFTGQLYANSKLEVNDTNGIPIRFQDISAAITGQTAGYIGMSTSAFSGNNGDLVLYPRTSATSKILLMGGNVGIGTTSPNSQLSVVNNTSGTATTMGLYNSTLAAGSGGGYEFWYNSSIRLGGIYQKTTSDGNNFYMSFESYAGAGGATERMRITSGGAIQINTTSGAATLNMKSVSSGALIKCINAANGDGTIYAYGTSTTFDYAFNTYSVANAFYLYNNGNYDFAGSDVSDLRLKENIKTIDYNAIEKLMQLVPKSYNMIKHPDIKRSGFIAQEVQQVLPDFISGEETETDYLGVDYNGILALAVKAIQEQNQTITELSNRLIKLESK
jgi:hypothetical protein